MPFPEYAGLSYEQASCKATELLQRAAVEGNWILARVPERLLALRERMERDCGRALKAA